MPTLLDTTTWQTARLGSTVGEIRYLGVAEVIALHNAIMERTGFPPAPLRSEGGLESAVMRARTAAYYEQADLIRQTALLAVGVAQAQAFLDGNKRTAFACLDVFLRVNRHHFAGGPIDLAQQLEAIATRQDTLPEATQRFEAWLRERVQPTP